MNQNIESNTSPVSRRQFLKASTVAAAAVTAFPGIVHAQNKTALKAVVIGVGGRGSEAGRNFLEAAKIAGVEAKIVAVADVYPESAAKGTRLYDVPADKCFSGFDAYHKALAEPGVNYVIIATPPGFRPTIYKAAVEAGKIILTNELRKNILKQVLTENPESINKNADNWKCGRNHCDQMKKKRKLTKSMKKSTMTSTLKTKFRFQNQGIAPISIR